MSRDLELITAMLLDETSEVSLEELSSLCGARPEDLAAMVSEGLLHPLPGTPGEWRFSGIEVRRARRAVRLTRDLEINLAGAALATELLEELEALRARVRALECLLRLDERG